MEELYGGRPRSLRHIKNSANKQAPYRVLGDFSFSPAPSSSASRFTAVIKNEESQPESLGASWDSVARGLARPDKTISANSYPTG
jgi:hypothetical protein